MILKSLSIKQKLTAIAMLASCTALVLAGLAFVAYDMVRFRSHLVREVSMLARVIGEIAATGSEGSESTLAMRLPPVLERDDQIDFVMIRAMTGEVLFTYQKDGKAVPVPEFREPGIYGSKDRLELFQNIDIPNHAPGILYLRLNHAGGSERAMQLVLVILPTLLVASLAAYLLAARLQRLVSDPILHLVAVARKVSEDRNYSLRANSYHQDEIGLLIRRFNEMLTIIHARDIKQTDFNRRLEERVSERTNKLQEEIRVRQEIETELAHWMDRLKQTNRDLQDFAYLCSHDLQEPLRKVIGFGRRLKTRFGDQMEPQAREYLERMEKATERMQSLIVDLLGFSRLTTHAKPFVSVNLEEVVRSVVSDLDVLIEEKAGRINIGELVILEADPVQMRQLFQNLIENALKYSRRNVPPLVSVTGNYVKQPLEGGLIDTIYQLVVKDNGIGFEERYAERIFGIFQRLHGRGEYEGTGIGLAVCRKIAERHGGRISAKSIPGVGSEFIVWLKIKHQKEDARDGEGAKIGHDSDGGR